MPCPRVCYLSMSYGFHLSHSDSGSSIPMLMAVVWVVSGYGVVLLEKGLSLPSRSVWKSDVQSLAPSRFLFYRWQIGLERIHENLFACKIWGVGNKDRKLERSELYIRDHLTVASKKSRLPRCWVVENQFMSVELILGIDEGHRKTVHLSRPFPANLIFNQRKLVRYPRWKKSTWGHLQKIRSRGLTSNRSISSWAFLGRSMRSW